MFILIITIEFSEDFKSSDEGNVLLFFLIIEKTRSSATLLCGIVSTHKAIELNKGILPLDSLKLYPYDGILCVA